MWVKTAIGDVQVNERVRFKHEGVVVSSEVIDKYLLNMQFHVELFAEPEAFAMSPLREVEVWRTK